jgi:hypothetical protein
VQCTANKVSEAVPEHALRSAGGSRYVAPVIFKLSSGWMWVVSFKNWLLYSWGKSNHHPVSVRLGDKSLAPIGNWITIPHLSTTQPRHYTNRTIPNKGYIFPQPQLKYINNNTHILSYSSFLNYYPINYCLCKFMSELYFSVWKIGRVELY